MKRGLTLVEVLVALVLFSIVLVVVQALLRYSAATYMEVEKELSEGSSTGMRFFDTAMHRIIRAQSTEIRDNNKTLVITYKKNKGKANALIKLEGNNLVYYPQEGMAEKQYIATNVKDVKFTHDSQRQTSWVEGNPVPDGIAAPVYYYTATGPARVAIDVELQSPLNKSETTHMRTAAVPRLASLTQEKVAWLSPVVEGRVEELKEIDQKLYARILTEYVAMHAPSGVQKIEPTIIMVAVPLNLRYKLEEQLGKQIMFMGDVLPDMVDGHYAMKMNPAYGGGVIMDTEQIAAAGTGLLKGRNHGMK